MSAATAGHAGTWPARPIRAVALGALATAAALLGAAAPSPHAHAADPGSGWPSRPVRIVIGSSPGGVVDVSARVVGQRLAEAWKQQVIADNRPGAGGVVAAAIVAGANPDGHTLLSISASHVIAPSLYAKLPYDTLKDFSAVAMTVVVPSVLAVSPGLGVRSAKELVALARAKPGTLLFSSGGIGSGTHFAAELFLNLAAIEARHVPFKGIPEAMTEAVTGRVQFTLSPVSTVMPFLKDGRALALGVTSGSRVAAMPDVPTLAEAGIPGYRWDPWFGLVAPAKTPRPVVEQIGAAVRRVVALPEVAQQWAAMGGEPMPAMSPAEMDRYLAAQLSTVAKLAAAAGIRPE
ncbi:MAG: tripartite tricarboxylate transporter substrate-binding protein [bacterium]|jgi:tripartite-type tricarboxylate transporter receptor subunit TctC|nr:tripartite tricarboxylate transporter substrate binding protein [Betaproteobacteria bacterium]